MTTAWFSCEAGASGDMMLGALVDAGAPLASVQAAIDALAVEPILLSTEEVTRQGVTATRVQVGVPASDVVRTWGNIRHLLETAELPEPVRAQALDVFARLAVAESRAHRVEPEQVHFHEVGALDALADVVGACAALDSLGITAVGAGPVALGSGMVRSSHGLLPVPGPAVLALLADAGAPVHGGVAPYEMCTPTGAALLASTVTAWGPLPPMRLRALGAGAGSRDLDEVPNVLRVLLGDPVGDAGAATTAVQLSANIDDLDPRLWPPLLARLMGAGASDAWLTPILMKKGRPAHAVSVLAPESVVPELRRLLFAESTTIGLREQRLTKWELPRSVVTVDVSGRPIRVKLAYADDTVVNVSPEFSDVISTAVVLGRPTKAVLAEAVAAAEHLWRTPAGAADDAAHPPADPDSA